MALVGPNFCLLNSLFKGDILIPIIFLLTLLPKLSSLKISVGIMSNDNSF